ncbi:MAG: class I SAM-dependent methyltransferase [Dehalococcoidia bacterium]|nr:MAG: class I SAM-dependent methyltransferase [Dehalococcoidia bacterium]
MNLKSFDRVAHCYDDTRGMPPDAARAVGNAIAAIARDVSHAPRLLEVGIGTGRIAVPLAEAGVRVTGIDIAPKMLAVLRQKLLDRGAGFQPASAGVVDVLLAEASRPPLRDATFDATLFVHILHLVPDAEATLRATARLVHSGGVILFGYDQGRIGQRAQADDIIARAVEEIAGVPIPTHDKHDEARDLTERVLRQLGAAVTITTVASWPERARGRTMLDRLGRKDYSSSWLIPDDALPAVIERVTPQLDALYGGLEREIEWTRTFQLLSGRLPGEVRLC